MSNRERERVRLIVVGAAGRMGARLCALAHAEEGFALAGALERAGAAQVGRASTPESARGTAPKIMDSSALFPPSSADCVVDFSSDAGATAALDAARRVGCALLIGTTALSPATQDVLRRESAQRAVLVSPNMSPGVALLGALVRRAAGALPGYECSLVEAHHAQKRDAPSGTALRLAEAAREGGAAVAREQIHSIRAGDVIGEHTVRLTGPGEYLELTHRATSRDLFVRGALKAAAWLKGRAPGWYSMQDVLNLGAD